jgi:HPt (histidine-containing phosphotransfer) domain-containing protein
MSRAKTNAAPGLDARVLADGCRQVAQLLDDALKQRPQELGEEVDQAERMVARLRDGLIDRLRAHPGVPDAARTRAALDRLNVALSLIVGVEYPAGGIQRELIEQASDTLRAVADRGE